MQIDGTANTYHPDALSDKQKRMVMIADVKRAVCAHYGISDEQIVSARRTKDLVTARQVAFYLCSTLTKASLPMIGGRFNKDHTTVLHGAAVIGRKMQNDEVLSAQVALLKEQLEAAAKRAESQ